MSVKNNKLDVPPGAYRDPEAFEIARIWAAGGAQHVTLAPGIWEDPRHWGLMLADLARHVANAYEQLQGIDPRETIQFIREGFQTELDYPTSRSKGKVKE